jgi:thiamine transporter ThiT
MALGMAWYGAWAEPWMKYTGITEAQAKEGPAMMYVLSFLGAIIYALTLNWLLSRLAARGFGDGAKYGFIIGMVFCFITVMNENAYQLKPVELGLINSIYPVIALALMGGLIAAWRKESANAPNPRTQG